MNTPGMITELMRYPEGVAYIEHCRSLGYSDDETLEDYEHYVQHQPTEQAFREELKTRTSEIKK